VFAKLRGSHQGSTENLHVNPEHVALVFNRQKRVIIRMMDGVEIALEPEYTDAGAVANEIHSSRVNPWKDANAEDLLSKILGGGKVKSSEEDK
jgi:hypothetical protein